MANQEKISFSKSVKNELAKITSVKTCCLRAQSYGLLLFGRSFSSSSVRVLTESEDVARSYSECSLNYTGIEPSVVCTKSGKYSVKFDSLGDRMLIINSFGHSEKDVVLRINRSNFEDDCCYGSFLRGAFLSCGTVTDPNKNYHLEFIIQYKKLCEDMMKLMEDVDLKPKLSCRKGSYVIYFKDSENVEDVLTIMGATDSSLELMGIKMVKSVRNRINRQINFETANISRTVTASLSQVNAIKKIRESAMFDSLPEQLKEVALLREENPDMSLDELRELMQGQISRSGVNHRLNKLIQIAESIK